MKKILSIALVLVMVLSLGTVAFADSQLDSLLNGIFEMVVVDKTAEARSAMSVIGTIIDVATGKVSAEEIDESVNVIPNKVVYKSINAYQHYVQVLNSDGEVLLQKAEAHVIGLDGVCARCGAKVGVADHVHIADHVGFVCLNSGFHEVVVYCACGEQINVERWEHHTMVDGVCVLCGYGKSDPDDPGEDDPGHGGNGDKDPGDKIREGDFDGNHYEIWFKPGVTWEEAEAFAEGMTYGGVAGHLVCITSAEEQAFLEGLNSGIPGLNLWIGAKLVDSAWTWVNGDEWGYENWAENQPVDTKDYIYGAMMPAFWYNLPNDGLGKIDGYIVEFDGVGVKTYLQDDVTAEEAGKVQSNPTGDMTVTVNGTIADVESSSVPAWLYVVCAVAGLALAGGVVVLVATKKKA